MIEWFRSWFLGLIQGLTEFLPISSDGHLSLFQILTRREGAQGSETGSDFIFFDVMLHVGTTVAIVWYYRDPLLRALRGFFGRRDEGEGYSRGALVRLGFLVLVATLPLGPLKLFFMDTIEQLYQSLTAVGLGFLATAVVLVITFFLPGGSKGPREMTWIDALVIGLAQALAPLPGVSRSGMTVAAGLIRGLSKGWAVGFSLMIVVPAIVAASASELMDANITEIGGERWLQILTATLIAGVVGYFAISWLVRVVRSSKLWYFAVYLFLLSGWILLFLVPTHATKPNPNVDAHTLDRAQPRRFDLDNHRLDREATRVEDFLARSR